MGEQKPGGRTMPGEEVAVSLRLSGREGDPGK